MSDKPLLGEKQAYDAEASVPDTDGPKARPHRMRLLAKIACIALFCLFKWSLFLQWSAYTKPLDRTSARTLALDILSQHPLIDTHVDLPIAIREDFHNALDFDLNKENVTSDVSLPALKRGHVGGFFFSCYVACASDIQQDEGPDFLTASWRVRDTLEQIDIAKLIMAKYPKQFQFAVTSKDIRKAHKAGKMAGLIGIEGAHQLGNSLAVLRQYRELGVRYMTLTHACHNAFADSCGYEGAHLEPLHNGLSPLGKTLIQEMNRIGMVVDISHTSDDTANQALSLSLAPPIWSHSNARAVFDVRRSVPDSILERIARADKGDKSETGLRSGDALISVNFVTEFLSADPANVTLAMVADQIDYIGRVAGRSHVGIGSDFDGMGPVPRVQGLEDVSKYPDLVAELLLRMWTSKDVQGLIGGNLMRVLDKVDAVSAKLQRTTAPATDVYSKRKDL